MYLYDRDFISKLFILCQLRSLLVADNSLISVADIVLMIFPRNKQLMYLPTCDTLHSRKRLEGYMYSVYSQGV